jgi:hypothetical protein
VLFVVLSRGCAYEEECLNRDTGRAYNGSTLKVSERERETERKRERERERERERNSDIVRL